MSRLADGLVRHPPHWRPNIAVLLAGLPLGRSALRNVAEEDAAIWSDHSPDLPEEAVNPAPAPAELRGAD